jgi:hypothetical protein
MSLFLSSYSSLPISPPAYRLSRISLADSERPFQNESPEAREDGPHTMHPVRPRIMKTHRANMMIMATGTIHHHPIPKQQASYPHISITSFPVFEPFLKGQRHFVPAFRFGSVLSTFPIGQPLQNPVPGGHHFSISFLIPSAFPQGKPQIVSCLLLRSFFSSVFMAMLLTVWVTLHRAQSRLKPGERLLAESSNGGPLRIMSNILNVSRTLKPQRFIS